MENNHPFPKAFGDWQIDTLPQAARTNFALGSLPEEHALPVWRKDLPSNAEEAAQILVDSESSLSASLERLDSVSASIDSLIQRVQATQQINFAAGVEGGLTQVRTAGLSEAELELLNALTGLSTSPLQPSYGLGISPAGVWNEARGQFQAFLNQIQRMVGYAAWVETSIEGRWVGRTIVGWSGDQRTAWQERVEVEQFSLHRQSLDQAVRSRTAIIRMLAITTQTAVKISTLISVPGGALLALPAAWRYVQQMLEQIDKHQQTIPTQQGD